MKKNLLCWLLCLLVTGFLLYAIPPTMINSPRTPLISKIDQAISTAGKASIDLYLMSLCPYGIEAQKALLPILVEKGNQVHLNLYFIAKELPGNKFQSLHGEPEVQENRRQLSIARNFPGKLVQYLAHRLEHPTNPDWEASVMAAGLHPADIDRLMNTTEELAAFRENIAMGNSKKIFSSPTIFINKEPYREDHNSWQTCKCKGGFKNGEECNSEGEPSTECPSACQFGFDNGKKCDDKEDCRSACKGGSRDSLLCSTDSNCPGGFCLEGFCYNTGTCTECPLPVKLVQFNGTISNDVATLTWQTNNETDNKGFEVQHSRDGQQWKQVGFIEGSSSDLVNNYQWISGKLSPGLHYYRLKQIDLNGKFEIHPPITVKIISDTELTAQVFPNPTTGSTSILIHAKNESRVDMHLINTLGQKVFQKSYQVKKGGNVFLLDAKQLPVGQLTMIIESKGQIKAKTSLVITK